MVSIPTAVRRNLRRSSLLDVRATGGRPGHAGWATLIAAAVVVGLAIAVGGVSGKALNGVGGILWLAAAVDLARTARRARVSLTSVALVAVTVLVLSSAISPRDLALASVGFLVGGMVVAVGARPVSRRYVVVGLLPATWLPAHLVVAVVRAIARSLADKPNAIRTDPPPTAALVPLAMVLAALAGGWIVTRLAGARRT